MAQCRQRYYTYKGLAVHYQLMVMSRPILIMEVSSPFFIARDIFFYCQYRMSTAVLFINVVPSSDENRVNRVSN